MLARQLRERPATPAERLRQAARAVMFGVVGVSGVVVNTAVLWFFYHQVGLHAAWGAVLATQASTLWNFALVDFAVYRGRKRGTRRGRALRFVIMNNLLLLGRMPIFLALVATGEARAARQRHDAGAALRRPLLRQRPGHLRRHGDGWRHRGSD